MVIVAVLAGTLPIGQVAPGRVGALEFLTVMVGGAGAAAFFAVPLFALLWPTLALWARVVRRAPLLERSWPGVLLAVVVLAVAVALAIDPLASGLGFDLTRRFHGDLTVSTLRIAAIAAGLLLPRLLLPQLRPGALLPDDASRLAAA